MLRFSNLFLIFLFLSFFILSSCVSTRSNNDKTNKQAGRTSLNFIRPLSSKYVITQRFKPKRNRKHKGMDLAGRKSSPIFAVEDGRVVYAGSKFRGYGIMILMEHADGFSSLYSHMNKIFVKSGDLVKKGHHLGAMGRTGRATGVHLHFELMKNKNPINPEIFINF